MQYNHVPYINKYVHTVIRAGVDVFVVHNTINVHVYSSFLCCLNVAYGIDFDAAAAAAVDETDDDIVSFLFYFFDNDDGNVVVVVVVGGRVVGFAIVDVFLDDNGYAYTDDDGNDVDDDNDGDNNGDVMLIMMEIIMVT